MKNFDVIALTSPESEAQLYTIWWENEREHEWLRWTHLFEDEQLLRSTLAQRQAELTRDSLDATLILQKTLAESGVFSKLLREGIRRGSFRGVLPWKDFTDGATRKGIENFRKTIYPGNKNKIALTGETGEVVVYDKSHARLYALRFSDDTLVIIGGCLKTTKALQDSVFTRHIPLMVNQIAKVFEENGVTRNWFDGSYFHVVNEFYADEND